MAAFFQELRFASRRLRKSPGFTGTVVLTLALGIGATTAIFSLVEAILLRPLPFSDPDRLVLLGDHVGDGPGISVTAREIGEYKSEAKAFSSVGGYITANYELSGGAMPEEVNAARLSAGIFPTLGVSPELGRVFTQQEEDGHQPVAVISYALWTSRYRRDRRVLGTAIDLDRKVYSIIGVMPRSFEFPLGAGHLDKPQLWVPLSLLPEELSDQYAGFWGYQMIARMKDGVTRGQAAEDARRVSQNIMRGFPASMAAIHIRGDVALLSEFAIEDVRPLLRTLFLAVSVVLLIACVNTAGLLLVRAIRRRREYAVRLALGARPGVIVRESVCEGLLLSLGGGVVGLAFAAVVIRTALNLLPDSMPRVDSISIDATVAAFALLLALVTGGLCSLAPAFAALRTNLTQSLNESARTGTGAQSHSWLRSGLVVTEIAIALVLLTVSGAFLRSFQKMRAVDPGFRADHVLVAGYQLPLRQYATATAANVFNHELIERLRSKPGILAAGIAGALPASGSYPKAAYTIEGEPAGSWKLKFAMFATVYGDYFRALQIPLIDGRYFNQDDRSSSGLVVIVNQSMAAHSWPGQRAVGKRMHVGNPREGYPWATVVGVVADTKMGSRDEPSEDQWYLPAEQPATLFASDFTEKLTDTAGGYITIRSAEPPQGMTQTLRSTVAEVDPLLALQQVQRWMMRLQTWKRRGVSIPT